jgi:hypothetical protein
MTSDDENSALGRIPRILHYDDCEFVPPPRQLRLDDEEQAFAWEACGYT